MIGAGRVSIDGMPAAKPATAIAVSAALTVEGADQRSWVSRGAHKLIGALDAFGVPVDGRRAAGHPRRLLGVGADDDRVRPGCLDPRSWHPRGSRCHPVAG